MDSRELLVNLHLPAPRHTRLFRLNHSPLPGSHEWRGGPLPMHVKKMYVGLAYP